MGWLNYSDDEVTRFHPVFEQTAQSALVLEGLDSRVKWVHHLRTPGNTLIPDFVLCDRDTGRWRLALEIKRTRASVHSAPNQVKAKGYTEASTDLYPANVPKYFSISNLEQTILFALKDGSPPNECRLQDGCYEVGTLSDLPEEVFRGRLTTIMRLICRRVLEDAAPAFDQVWPSIISRFIQCSSSILGVATMAEPCTPRWDVVRDYFCHPVEVDAARLFLFRCVLSEYLRGVLQRFGHPEAGRLLPLVAARADRIGPAIARALARLREIEFQPIVETSSIEMYRHLSTPVARSQLAEYVASIVTPPSPMEELARNRLDRNEFLNGLIHALHYGERLDERGKVITDPELASLLANMTIDSPNLEVLDPCCGDGSLLEAAYDRLASFGMGHNDILARIHGAEADPLFTRLAFLRLMLKNPESIGPSSLLDISQADMFARPDMIEQADVILMNPPFKRYEAQDLVPVPAELKTHYADAINMVSGSPSISTTGQQNFYTYYVEYILHAAKVGCRFGIILDNKWYQNTYAQPLKRLILDKCALEAIVDYPYSRLFSGWTIATTILVCRKLSGSAANVKTKFARCSLDLTQVNPSEVGGHFKGRLAALPGWTCREIDQQSLDVRTGWKNYFANELIMDFRDGLPKLTTLFAFKRRGSLAKEEGGMSSLSFPFSRRRFGFRREAAADASRRYQNRRVRELTPTENAILRRLASGVPQSFRGYAIETSDQPTSYLLREEDLLRQPTMEPPSLRGLGMFWSEEKTPWTEAHRKALIEIHDSEPVAAFVEAFRSATGLSSDIMPDEWLWVGLREPYAGELVIPRKLRAGHRVHVNPYACATQGRQVRISSNFVSFSECVAIDDEHGLDRLTSVRLIAAFLVSSFGQLQFEMEGYNREGCLSVELNHLEKVRVLDPRDISEADRTAVLDAFSRLPFPVPTDTVSSEMQERNTLDHVLARIICQFHPGWLVHELIAEVHHLLDEYLISRNP